MNADKSPTPSSTNVAELLSELANGNATGQAVAAKLRAANADVLDLLVGLLERHATTSTSYRRAAQSQLDLQAIANPRSAGLPTKHKTPLLPFVLNGTLYDPADITRFDGTELHFLPADDHIIAIDDRAVMAEVWRNSYLMTRSGRALPSGFGWAPGSYTACEGSVASTPDMGTSSIRPQVNYGPIICGAVFCEDSGFGGDGIDLYRNNGYPDLTRLGRGFLGSSDWNDTISSFYTTNYVVVLYENINYAGSTY
jgi:hypothetical protein